jgi:cytochrome c2
VELLIAKGAQLPPPDKIEPLLASASPKRCEEHFLAKCRKCHALAETNTNEIGPSLWNVVGSRQSVCDDFDYSAAFNRLNGVWSFENLNMLLLDSNNYFPDNNMNRTYKMVIFEFQDRADIISFVYKATSP